MDPSRTSAHDPGMEIGLGLIFLVLLAMALWVVAGEPAVAMVEQVVPDQTDAESDWDLLGWRSLG
jgi:hypothetical protein